MLCLLMQPELVCCLLEQKNRLEGFLLRLLSSHLGSLLLSVEWVELGGEGAYSFKDLCCKILHHFLLQLRGILLQTLCDQLAV